MRVVASGTIFCAGLMLAAALPARAGAVRVPADIARSAPQASARSAVPPGPVDRARTYERVLGPGSAEETLAAATPTKDAKSRAEAAAAYDRALVFYQQGAFAEAEKEFRNAEKKDGDNLELVLAAAWIYTRVHKPDEALKRYERIYKKNPRNVRALMGMAAAYEEMQNYREAVRVWQRYVRAGLSPAEVDEGQALLRTAQDLFVKWYEIAENPAGGAVNALTREQELQLGQKAAQDFAKSGVEPLRDEIVTKYIEQICQTLVSHAKNFPTNYEAYVIDTADVNAFTIPGFIFVNRGLLAATGSEAELAGVLAHEIGHAVAHHSAKKLTKAVQDEQQAEQWKNSNNKFLRWLGNMSASGANYGLLSFSREAEEQADRLAVHISYDSGFDPRGFASFFQKLESIDPSSRKSWELMQRTHPFSIDRLNTIDAYIALLPGRPVRPSSPEFVRMQTRLAALPPPADATGQVRAGGDRPTPPSPPPATTGGAPGATAGTRSFTMDSVPFAGEIPGDWEGRKTQAGTVVFEGPKGTESYEVSIEVGFEPKRQDLTIDQLAQSVVEVLSSKPRAEVQPPARETADDGTPVRIIKAAYSLQASSGTMFPLKHVTVLLDYPGYYAILSYYTPESIYQKYSEVFTRFIQQLRYTGR